MNVLILGLQWGDEGKGKAIDYLAGNFDVVVRYQGGHNAGHTVYFGERKFVLHLLPSGIFYPHTISVISSTVVIDPLYLVAEIESACKSGLNLNRLFLSEAAPLILPFHQHLDIVFEDSRYLKIGTTRRGIGPAYEDLTGRRAVFIYDLLDKDRFYRQVKPLNDYYNKLISIHGGAEIAVESYLDKYVGAGQRLKPMVVDTMHLLHRYASEGKRMLFEGAQGTLLDITLGTYPFVTASHPTVGGVMVGTGLSHKAIQKVIGISKAYTTRVGEGPFPTELTCSLGSRLREKGDEYGATTGRPRRVGWLDLVALKYAVMVNGVDSLFLTKLDVLGGMEEIRAAVSYEIAGEKTEDFPIQYDKLQNVQPIFESFPGWKSTLLGAKSADDLPQELHGYIAFIEKYLGIPIEFLSVGTHREQTIHLRC